MTFAVLLKTHFFDAAIAERYARLVRESPRDARGFIALNRGNEPARLPADTLGVPPAAFFLFNHEQLLALAFPTKCARQGWQLNPGNADLIPLLFMARHPAYDPVWGIEYDVHFEGAWRRLFDHFRGSDADLLATTIHRQVETPQKVLTPPFRSPEFADWPEDERIRAFLPIYGLSRRGAAAIEKAYRAGAGGHYELTWATILHHAGLVLEDIGGNGEWVRPENVNRFYFNTKHTYSMSPGTFVFRPNLSRVMRRPNTLWHPVKPARAPVWHGLTFRGARGVVEAAKPKVFALVVRSWFLTRWNRLR